MIKRILLVTHSFPYGAGETFLEPELECFPNNVELIVLPVHSSSNAIREIQGASSIVLPLDNASNKSLTIFLKSLFSSAFFCGLQELKISNKFDIKSIKLLLSFTYSGMMLSHRMSKILSKNNIIIDNETLIYSYWMDSAALGAYYLANDRAKIICRAHGADLYDERTDINHQFLRTFMCKRFDGVFPISVQGMEYLKNRTGCTYNITAYHLGVKDHGNCLFDKRGLIRIVSCSNVIHLKRLDIIIDALSQLKGINFKWTHFGDGELMESIKLRALNKLDNGSFEFKGRVSNSDIHHFYQNNNVSMFINVSDTEGIPVSIMEAISYGIPVIATDVGGVSELITNGYNGFLISPNDTSSLLKAVYSFIHMNNDDYIMFRENARTSYLKNWDAKKNFASFYNTVLNIT